jgi:hypothetical protein
MKKASRLDSISPTLSESLESVSVSQRRQVAITMCAMAINHTGLQDENVQRVMELLHCGGAVDPEMKQKLDALCHQLDEQYLDLNEGSDSVTPEALQIFRKARAVSALAHAASPRQEEVYDAIYEAIHATGDQTGAIRVAENALQGVPGAYT